MTSERKRRIEELVRAALEQEGGQRAAFLEEACAGDSALRHEVDLRIAVHEHAGGDITDSPLEGPGRANEKNPTRSVVGRRLGSYRLLREIGCGGMGKIYLAVRADDEYKKQVAIKLIREDLMDDTLRQRFLTERQILAGLDHPNIAKLLDGGTTAEGLVYFVMDYVEGLPIDVYCDSGTLSVTERLQLFLTVCSAVHYAHQNLVVHRDIKPGNILVTTDGMPKLLDFGIAKLLHPSATAHTIGPGLTGHWLMTPDYASPEQVRGNPVTTACDIYSLGVLLYELLTGHRPYQTRGCLPSDISHMICEIDPEKPSVAVTRIETVVGDDGVMRTERTPESVSRTREGQPGKLCRRLQGDLDNIVLMAMRKEPHRRYSSAEQLAQDVRRHLRALPVIAREDTLGYRADKFVRRHKTGVTAAALTALILLAGIAATAWQTHKAGLERAKAERRFNDVRGLANALIFELQSSIEKLPGSTAAQALLVKRALEYLDRLAQEAGGDPSLQLELAAAYARLGNIQWNRYYANLGDRASALQSQRKALSIRAGVSGADSENQSARREVAFSLRLIGDLLVATGDPNAALEHYSRSMKIWEELVAARPQHAGTRRELAITYQRLGDTLGDPGWTNLGDQAGATEYYRKMQAIFEALVAEDATNTQDRHSLAIGYEKFGRIRAAEGDWKGALELYRKELAIFQESAAAAPTNVRFRRDVTVGYGNVGETLAQLGDYEGALENYRAVLKIREELVAADRADAGIRRDLAFIEDVMAGTLAAQGHYAEALEHYRKAVSLFEELYAADARNQSVRTRFARTLQRLAALLVQLGQNGSARSYAARALEIRKAEADRPEATPKDLNEYAQALLTCEPFNVRNPQTALSYVQRAVERTKGNDPAILDTLALAHHMNGDPAHAVEAETKAIALLQPNAPQRREMETRLATFKEAAR